MNNFYKYVIRLKNGKSLFTMKNKELADKKFNEILLSNKDILDKYYRHDLINDEYVVFYRSNLEEEDKCPKEKDDLFIRIEENTKIYFKK